MPPFVVKICGVTSVDDALAAVNAGATALGFNFFNESPRYIAPTGAALITERLPAGVLKVGVFVNEEADAIARIAGDTGLDVVQLHGSAECPAWRSWRAVPARGEADMEVSLYPEAEALLFDSVAPGLYGGTGRTFDWTLAHSLYRKIIIAGGLDESNVARAIAEARPWGVDACSRLETSPGKKDHLKMTGFIQAARAEFLA